MNISRISQAYNNSFKGLWGKTTSYTDRDEAMGIMKRRETKLYYPFANETQVEIDNIANQNTSAVLDSPSRCYLINECKIGTRLPFTEEEFLMYKGHDGKSYLSEKIKSIHSEARTKYINSAIDKQESAQNDNIQKRLNCYY